MRRSPPAAGLLLGAIVGIADAIILQTNFGRSQGPVSVAPLTWAAVIWTWITIGCLTGVVFASPRWGPFRGAALALTGPCLLLLGRGTTPFKALLHLSTSQVALIWAALSVGICLAAAFVRFERARSLWPYAIGSVISALLLVWFAANVRVGGSTGARSVVPGKHNVALIVLDTVRHDDVVAQMPQLQAFARGALTFDNAWSSAPWTVPAHFALLTGADPWTVPFPSVARGFEYAGPRLAEDFRSRGYDTSAVFANPLLNEGAGFARGFEEFTVSIQSRVCRSALGALLGKSVTHGGPAMPLCGWLIAPQVSARAMQFVRQKSGRPYFVAMNFIDAHDPYYVPPGCRDRSFHAVPRRDQQKLLDASPGRRLDPLMVARTHGQYRMAMRCMDRTLGSLLRALDDGNTVIAVVGDHGEQFGEHGWGGHGNTLYRQLLHVPLILKIPGRVPARVNDPVSTADLFATLIRASQAGRMRAPIPLLDAGWRRPVIANFDMRRHRSLEGGFSIVRGDLHFTRSTSGRENLFDYRADPLEDLPLSPSTHRPIIDPMRARLLHAAGQQRRRVEFDALGYLN